MLVKLLFLCLCPSRSRISRIRTVPSYTTMQHHTYIHTLEVLLWRYCSVLYCCAVSCRSWADLARLIAIIAADVWPFIRKNIFIYRPHEMSSTQISESFIQFSSDHVLRY